MKSRPTILVQLVHIQGAMKGQIQEFSGSEIAIGRHPSCHVHFPKDEVVISRKHARIIREGNRFKLIDQSTNGTFVNGKRVKEIYLKDGDVLAMTKKGPKLSFLTKIIENSSEIKDFSSPGLPEESEVIRGREPTGFQPQMKSDLAEQASIQSLQAPLVIQYGPTLHSFNQTPVTIGKNASCDFTLNHPAILDRHAQIFFSQGQYWIKDLTGLQKISINGQPVHLQAPLSLNSRLSLSPEGPSFRFLGDGRLAEIEGAVSEEPMMISGREMVTAPRKGKKDPSRFKKIFRR